LLQPLASFISDLVITNPCLLLRQVLLISLYPHQNLKTIGRLWPLRELVVEGDKVEAEEEATGALGLGLHPKPVEMLTQLWQLC
jgi:hypothetical protein